MQPIESLFDIEWNPRVLIEASAGTGKTYTLTALYVRLLIEKKLNVDQILVMTFTKKATSELKERIFKRLKECLNSLEVETSLEDPFLKEFVDSVKNRDETIERIQSAIQNFDDSQVFTIHGFCQKILKEEALLAGTPFDFEVVQQDEILTKAVEDFWRSFMNQYSSSEAGKYYISKLLEIAHLPSELRDQLTVIFSKPYARLEGEGMNDPVGYLEHLLQIRRNICEIWKAEKGTIRTEFLECDLKYYTPKNVDSRIREMQKFVEDSSFTIDSFSQLKFFTSGYINDPENLKSGKNEVPVHPFFEVCDEYFELIQQIDKVKNTLIQEAIEEILKKREKLSINSNAITYDDLLHNLEKALIEFGDLSTTLQKKYPAALVDEFQDTDPVQYSILNSIYPSQKTDSSLVMIGDPKQAIYAFRGADVHTYIQARDGVGVHKFTLHENFRSTPTYNRAVNTLFGNSDHPFLEEGIAYLNVETGQVESENEFLLDGKPASGIRLIAKPGIDSDKNEADSFAFSHTISEISKLLHEADEGNVLIKNRKLEAGDIAVLVSSHRHAEEVKQRLKEVGIDSVTYSREKVFESAEARRLESVMAAILDPYNRIAVNNTLLSGFWGQNLNVIHDLSGEGELRQILIDELQELADVWARDGFYPMFRKLLFSDERMAKLAFFSNSERILTNLYQLADICAAAEKEGKLDPYALHSWFVDEMADPDKDDEKTLLLESDQNLVKISTVHNSKGLEFPVVFCPTLWDVKSGNKKPLLTEYHAEDGSPIIRYDQQKGEDADNAEFYSDLEKAAEEVRKYYVAVTRAKYLCVIPWANHNASLRSGLISSLLDSEKATDIIKNKIALKSETEFTDQSILNLFKGLKQTSEGSIEVTIKEENEAIELFVSGRDNQSSKLSKKTYNGRPILDAQRRVESFSSLAHHQTEPGEPDYDQVMESYLSLIHREKEGKRELNIFTFPRGATAGTAIHKLFEDKDFYFDSALDDDLKPIIETVLDQHQIDGKWTQMAEQMIRNVVSAKIPGLDLSRIKDHEQLREMEFHFAGQQALLENILKIIRQRENTSVSPEAIESFMTGFIDLVVRQNDKFFIVDYKSNYLGDTLDDYSKICMKEEIYNASYDVQYHLYTVALWKYLKTRNPGFNYEKDFGGVAYLFIRGMRKGEENGVWFHKPDEAVIRNLADELGVQL